MTDYHDTSGKHKAFTLEENAMYSGMLAGSLEPVPNKLLYGIKKVNTRAYGEVFKLEVFKQNHTPALLKIIDEIITNASDIAVERIEVTEIAISINSNAEIFVYNNGVGISTGIYPQSQEMLDTKQIKLAEGETKVRTVDVISSVFLSTSNGFKERANVKGGINGIGCKLTNLHSDAYIVETDDGINHYKRKWGNRKREVHPCTLAPTTGKQFTRIAFRPAYREFKYNYPLEPEMYEELEAYTRLRAFQVAAYLGKRCKVSFNGSAMEVSVKTLATLLSGYSLSTFSPYMVLDSVSDELIKNIVLQSDEMPNSQHPINVSVIILPAGKKALNKNAFYSMCVINGVMSNQSTVIEYTEEHIISEIRDAYKQLTKCKDSEADDLKDQSILSNLRFVIMGAVPGANWDSQNKAVLRVPAEIMNKYSFDENEIHKAALLIASNIIDVNDNKNGKKTFKPEKYSPAYVITRHEKSKYKYTSLLCAEGDSAIKFISEGIRRTASNMVPVGGPSPDYIGYISLHGVVMNALRQTTIIEVDTIRGKEIKKIQSEKLKNNIALNSLYSAIGLDYNKTYDNPEERASLNYGRVILCTDQDLDGIGKIAPLVLVWFNLFWPALLENGYVHRIVTPLIRLIGKQKTTPILQFLYQDEFDNYCAANPDWKKLYGPPSYYKGLGSYGDDIKKEIFDPAKFEQYIYKYEMNDDDSYLLELCYGDDSEERKKMIEGPPPNITYERVQALRVNRCIPVGEFVIGVDVNYYKRNALYRQIPGIIDGLNESKRKIIYTYLRDPPKGDHPKVFIAAAKIIENTKYVHGNHSMEDTLLNWMHEFAHVRYFEPDGSVGTMLSSECSSSRYVGIIRSPVLDQMFDKEDLFFLQYNYEEGEKIEPKYLVPKIPVAVLETFSIPSEGWNYTAYARDPKYVMILLRDICDPACKRSCILDLRDALTGHKPYDCAALYASYILPANRKSAPLAKLGRDDDYEYSVGIWRRDSETIIITALPLTLTVEAYIKSLTGVDVESEEKKKKSKKGKKNKKAAVAAAATEARQKSKMEYIDVIYNYSTIDTINIHVVFKPGMLVDLMAERNIEEFLLLRKRLVPQLNYYSTADTILECAFYHQAIISWLRERYEILLTRYNREYVIIDYKIIKLENKIKYIENVRSGVINPTNKKSEEFISQLEALSYVKLNDHYITHPDLHSEEELCRLISSENISYNYLLHMRQCDVTIDKKNELEAELAEIKKRQTKLYYHLNDEKPFAFASVICGDVAL